MWQLIEVPDTKPPYHSVSVYSSTSTFRRVTSGYSNVYLRSADAGSLNLEVEEMDTKNEELKAEYLTTYNLNVGNFHYVYLRNFIINYELLDNIVDFNHSFHAG